MPNTTTDIKFGIMGMIIPNKQKHNSINPNSYSLNNNSGINQNNTIVAKSHKLSITHFLPFQNFQLIAAGIANTNDDRNPDTTQSPRSVIISSRNANSDEFKNNIKKYT